MYIDVDGIEFSTVGKEDKNMERVKVKNPVMLHLNQKYLN